ncbi:MAG TPA: tryptophan halogenase family protein [Xanthomonadales bacterium]|nr:tryptophan halogenase family protein [Xanthomonadales bacterium]
MNNNINRVVIAGGGTAGWMAAGLLSKILGRVLDITLIESDQIGTVGVGEATIPPLVTYLRLLQIKEQDFMAATQGTFKLGISFENWKDVNERYIHSFGTTGTDHWSAGFQHFWLKDRERGSSVSYGDYCLELVAAQQSKFAHLPKQGLNYAFHIDATLFAAFLRNYSEKLGVRRVEGKIVDVNTNSETGHVESLRLDSAELIEGDLFIDCTGFRGLLIEQTLKTGYEDWTHWLPCDSAMALQTESMIEAIPYTRAIAHSAGWQWRIPLQHRVGNGLVYCNDYMSDEEAREYLLKNVVGGHLTEPRVLKFKAGRRRKNWNKNVVALGLASGFVEPLESTSIHLIQQGMIRLLQLFPHDGIKQTDIDEYNEQSRIEIEYIRDFIVMHYKVTNRQDTPFWQHCRNLEISDTLAHRIQLFRETGRVCRAREDLFQENSWVQVMMGQGITPAQYHPVTNVMTENELTQFMRKIRERVAATVAKLPNHETYVKQYCPSPD